MRGLVKMLKRLTAMGIIMGMMITGGCATDTAVAPVAGEGSVLTDMIRQAVLDIRAKYPLQGERIQVSPNNFWERETLMNLPFSSILSDSLAA
ncbi:MAG: hypothetical protein MI802_17365, partial [Desulfobacterales bacterium]|nr:hypothetical protein [Desulfobacterales bacterium]